MPSVAGRIEDTAYSYSYQCGMDPVFPVQQVLHENPSFLVGSVRFKNSLSSMAWNNVIGQERVVHTLNRALSSGRVAHAYIFHGPEGVGKRAVAFGLAQALQCLQPADGAACGACNACHKAQKGIHPDIHVLMPTTTDPSHKDIAARLQAMAEDPYATVDFRRRPSMEGGKATSNKQVFYSIDEKKEPTLLRRAMRAMSFHPVEGKYRVVIVIDADMMRKEAANAFLKLLEEPGDNTVFVLTTDRVDHVLPTILSRCQQMRFETLAADEIAAALVQRDYADPKTAAVLARMADGSLSRAIEFAASDELPQVREQVLDFLRLSYKGRGDFITPMVDQISAQGREYTKFLLVVALGIIRDLMLISDADSPEMIVNVDQKEALTKFVHNLKDARIVDMIEAIERTIPLIERNVNTRLALISLSIVLGNAMKGIRSEGIVTELV